MKRFIKVFVVLIVLCFAMPAVAPAAPPSPACVVCVMNCLSSPGPTTGICLTTCRTTVCR